ncbi:MAG: TatD family hydrolase [Bacteroidales bacterium]|nr:TatD family hydrolase [Bacteroidales bacterium]
MEFIDTHTHTYDEAFDGCEDEIIARALAAGVSVQLQADVDSRERERMFALVERHPGVLRPMLGLYPGSVDKDWRREIDALEAWRGRGIVAVGEIGLDYHYGADTKEEQKEAFRVQLELAAAWDLPVNIHLREATEDFFAILRDCRHLPLRGNLHAFSGSAETFDRLRRLGGDWYVGIGGVVTFKKASIGEDIKRIPLDRILLETDAPYLTPVPHRGERNESAYIPLIAAFVARQKGISLEEVAAATTANAKRLFSI